MRKMFWLLIFILLVVFSVGAQEIEELHLEFFGEASISSLMTFDDVLVGGLSGITYDPQSGAYYAISDASEQYVLLGAPRFYTLDIALDAEDGVQVEILAMQMIRPSADADFYPEGSVDAEGIRFLAASGNLLWINENDSDGVPALRIMQVDGLTIQAYPLPENYTSELRDNKALEALAISPDGTRIYLGTENGLQQEDANLSRILMLEAESGEALAEWVYPLEDIHGNGLTELLALDEDTLLALERAYSRGVGNTIHLFTVDVSEEEHPLEKTPVLALHEGDYGLDLDNIEGMTWGEDINGQRTLILVSDNNFNPPSQPTTQFLVFLVDEDE